MKRYLLLRNNRETGPYSLQQLRSMSLRPQDLLWVEGESTSWSYPTETDALKGIQLAEAPVAAERPRAASRNVFVSLPSNRQERRQDSPSPAPMAHPEEEGFIAPLPELRERTQTPRKGPVWMKPGFPVASLLNVVVVFAGVTAGAFLIKKAVDSYDGNTAVAIEQPVNAVTWPEDRTGTEKTEPATVVPIPVASTAVEKTPLKPVHPSDLRKSIRLTANKYNVGLFGGINGLKLTVSNTSARPVAKVVIAVDYLKPNGEAVDSRSFEVLSLKPNASKTLDLPKSARGVRVNYKIVQVV